jgi:[calcium/calmodulin-dependent protein kinase] kinase
MKDSAGTRAFLAPETFKKEKYKGKLADIWAGGVTLYYLVYGKLPFQGRNFFEMRKSIMEDEIKFPFPLDPKLEDLIRKSLIKDP